MTPKRVLYLVVCAAGLAPSAVHLVEVAQLAGWDVCVILTPRATNFVDIPYLSNSRNIQYAVITNDLKILMHYRKLMQ